MHDQGWYSEEIATFGDRLAGAREAADLTQAAFAENLGVTLDVVEAWEADLKEPRSNRLQMLSGLLGVSITWLLTGEGEGPTAPDDQNALSRDVRDMLAEMRVLRSQLAQSGEALGRLEKRMRAALEQDNDGIA